MFASKFQDYLAQGSTFFICSAGFETRSTALIGKIATTLGSNTTCILITLRNSADPKDSDNVPYQEQNIRVLKRIATERGIQMHDVTCDLLDKDHKPSGHMKLLQDLQRIIPSGNEDKIKFIVDVSCLPRLLMFPLLNYLYDTYKGSDLLIGVTENQSERVEKNKDYEYTEPDWIPQFEGRYSTDPDSINVWIPVLGLDKDRVERILNKYHFDTIFPFIGFPSSTPRDTDLVAKVHRQLFCDPKYAIGAKDVLYAPLLDPFLLYHRVDRLVGYLLSVPEVDNRTTISLSPFGTKTQSLGVFLCAKFLNAGIVYTQPIGYKPIVGDVGDSYIYYLRGVMYSGD